MEELKVDVEICTGCGVCIDVCPMDAIDLVDGVAHINNEECSNCRACESQCPVEAIS